MKKTLIALLALAAVAQARTDVTINNGETYTMDSTKTDIRLIFNTNGANNTFNVITLGDQEMEPTNGNGLNNLATATLNFTLGGTLTVTGDKLGGTWRNGITVNFDMGTNGALVTTTSINLVGLNSKMNLTTSTDAATLEEGIYTRDLITVGGNGSIWFSIKGDKTSVITLSDETLEAAGFTNKGVVALAADGTYTDLSGNAVELGAKEYAMVFSRADNRASDYPEKVMLLVNNTPEPATATLSLLALAGLASRRRRH